MTPRRGPSRKAKFQWASFRANARIHLSDAENKLSLLEDRANAKGIAADAVLAAIAYGDAITVQRSNLHNAKDHSALPALILTALGKDAESTQLERLTRIIARKNEAQYGGTVWSRKDAEQYLEQVRRFARWAERMLSDRE
jgi:hypothetical protein